MSQLREEMNRAGKECIDQAKHMKEQHKTIVRSRNKKHFNPIHSASKPEVREIKLASKCQSCSFKTHSREHFDEHMVHHNEGLKCDHWEETLPSRNVLKQHVFNTHKKKIICSYFIRGKCNRQCEFQHPIEIKCCRYGYQCPYLERGKCKYLHRVQQMRSGVFESKSTVKKYIIKT